MSDLVSCTYTHGQQGIRAEHTRALGYQCEVHTGIRVPVRGTHGQQGIRAEHTRAAGYQSRTHTRSRVSEQNTHGQQGTSARHTQAVTYQCETRESYHIMAARHQRSTNRDCRVPVQEGYRASVQWTHEDQAGLATSFQTTAPSQ